ncbi:PREDICTED: uncharacterized protein LOC104770564 isoform X3 [Camelina sativa]|uniref:Uncharacterized protein LOC104770564 isoform X3 n=1 Tax=Camelina sativa TaxID=90675 RepID=A0ABM0XZQ1_CAMSA|nr:PREDICTED: uncharacterized protein LOC104770564 isoform X3 [Camelina sativa]
MNEAGKKQPAPETRYGEEKNKKRDKKRKKKSDDFNNFLWFHEQDKDENRDSCEVCDSLQTLFHVHCNVLQGTNNCLWLGVVGDRSRLCVLMTYDIVLELLLSRIAYT